MIAWKTTKAAVFRRRTGTLKPIAEVEAVPLEGLIKIDRQKQALVENTENFLAGRFANNVLLWGSRGTGKSSLVKALLQAYFEEGLRIVEFFKEDLSYLPEVIDELRDEPYRFILYLDDLTFGETDLSYTYLKSAMEGSIESAPENVRVYATSNRRHLVPEYMSDNAGTTVRDGELHYGDSVEEKISLADRFGLWLSFYQGTQDDYLAMVEHYFKGVEVERETLMREALRFAAGRASRSGRTAKQFYLHFMQQLGR
ncbi:ATP-binding protein [Sulfurimonas sp. HSL1-2]|uniref:ATP-binding protein n=1 Tax=Thiomicrolovo zhangzhouensis TaxID=3131933 RepID=UPI0031F9E0FC